MTTESALIPLEKINAVEVFTGQKLQELLAAIRAEAMAVVPDVTTTKGRDLIKSTAYKVSRSKTTIDDAGKELVSDLKKQSGIIDAARKTARDTLDALRDEVRKPLDDWEAEQARIAAEKAAEEARIAREAEEQRQAEMARREAELAAREAAIQKAEQEAREKAAAEQAERERIAREKAEAERQARAAEAASRALHLWDNLPDGGRSDYLNKKKVKGFGLRYSRGSIVVPVRNAAGLVGLQFIDGNGDKKFLTGTPKQGAWHLIGDIASGVAHFWIAEGYATAASVHLATGEPVFVAFDAGNLVHVAQAVRSMYPAADLLIAADNDAATPGNPGVTKAREAAAEEDHKEKRMPRKE